MPRKTSEIVADLRAAVVVFFSEGQTTKDPDEHLAYLAHADLLCEAAKRLENASSFDVLHLGEKIYKSKPEGLSFFRHALTRLRDCRQIAGINPATNSVRALDGVRKYGPERSTGRKTARPAKGGLQPNCT